MESDNHRLTQDPRPEVWSAWQGAVLGKDEISFYATNCKPPLIDPFDPSPEKRLLKPASYHLRVGACCRVMGEDRILKPSDPLLKIDPFAVAIVSTLEEVNIPAFLIARWNLRVQRVYDGLIWTGSLQVDPGYSGHLFCPIFNLSTEIVTLKYGDPLFTIDFVRTTRQGELLKLERETHSLTALGELDTKRLKSGLGEIPAQNEALKKQVTEQIEALEEQVVRSQNLVIVILSIIIAAIAAVASVGIFGRFAVANCWGWASFALSIVAVLIGTGALIAALFARGKSANNR